jgi:hypothetical protein
VNVSSRFTPVGLTGPRGVLVSAVLSAGIGGPASVLRGPGIEVMLFAPAGEVRGGVGVAVGEISAATGEQPIGKASDVSGHLIGGHPTTHRQNPITRDVVVGWSTRMSCELNTLTCPHRVGQCITRWINPPPQPRPPLPSLLTKDS